MKIKTIHIQNFRSVRELNISELDPRMNILVGINGAGKTSILDSMACLLSWMIARMKSSTAKGVSPSESDITVGVKGQCILSLTLDNDTCWSISKNKSFSSKVNPVKTELQELSAMTERVVQNAENGGSVPVIMYYPVDRAIAAAPVNYHKSDTSIWDVYKNALSGNSNFRSLFEWYRRQEDIENEMIRDNAEYRDRNLEAVRRAIGEFFPEFSELRVRRRPRQAMIVRKGDTVIEFTGLSQGEKCYLSLVCDIARRLAIANPNLENPLDGEGVILIDEIDLHLHPKWQSEIVSKLMSVFKNCQFIVSTHSSLVLSDVKRNQIIPIENGKKVEISFEPYGKEASEIMTSYFDMAYQRKASIAREIEQAFAALRSGDNARFQELFIRLTDEIGPEDKDIVDLTIEAYRRGIYEKNQ